MNTPQDFTYDLKSSERKACQGLKVGSYWNSYTDKQKLEFCRLHAKGMDKNDIRSMLTAAKKQFSDNYQVLNRWAVIHSDRQWHYSRDSKTWYDVGKAFELLKPPI